MPNTVAREHARARHMTPQSTEEYLRGLGHKAVILDAAWICLEAGRVPADFAHDPELAAAMAELVAVP